MSANYNRYFLSSILIVLINFFGAPTCVGMISDQGVDDEYKRRIISGLIRDVGILEAHEEDYIDLFPDFVTSQVRGAIAKNIEANKKTISILEDVRTNRMREDKALTDLMFLRFSFINSRRTNALLFEKYRAANQEDLILFGPTAPELYNSLNSDQQFLARQATHKYQLLNKIILGIASLTNLRTLPGEAKKLLRASPTLCAIFEDSSRPLGHPDKTFVLDKTSGEMSDWEYLMSIKPQYEISTTVYSSFSKKETTMFVDSYEKQDFERGWRNPYGSKELPYPQFLWRHLPSVVIENTVGADTSFLSKISEKSKAAISFTDKKLLTKSGKLNQTRVVPEKQPVEKNSGILEKEKAVSVVEEASLASLKGEEDRAEESEGAETFLTPLPVLELEPDLPVNDKVPESAATMLKKDVRPRGMRAFHDQQQPSQDIQIVIKGHHRKILDKLFDVQQFSSVSYAEFASLWRHINGEDSIRESTASSHKALRDQAGNIVAGIYAHNANQRFGKRTIQYIRDAFRQIGYLPTE